MGIRTISNPLRAERLMRSVIEDLRLDLRGHTVLTEAASGNFAVTPLIAALAGADRVFAVTRDSSYGQAAEVMAHVNDWAEKFGVTSVIECSDLPALHFANRANMVTNLGFVRPIGREIIERLPAESVVLLMWETWEFRDEDVDIEACRERGIPVLGTNEHHHRIRTFDYLGLLAQKLLFDAQIEVFSSRVLVLGADPFGGSIAKALNAAGAEVRLLTDTRRQGGDALVLRREDVENLDAVVLAEHRHQEVVIGEEGMLPPRLLAAHHVPLVHISGMVTRDDCEAAGVEKFPPHFPPPGHMTVTTDYLGPRPVIDLHAAGLKVGQVALEHLRAGHNPSRTNQHVLTSGFGRGL